MPAHFTAARARRRNGFVLITMALAGIAMFGILGLAVDVGRMFIAKTETQAFCDAAAMAAVLQLDGSPEGLAAATAAVTGSTNTWDLNSRLVTATASPDGLPTYQVDFAQTPVGPWAPAPVNPAGYSFARVSARVPVGLYFVPIVASQEHSMVASAAVAAKISVPDLPRGLAPFTAVRQTTTGPGYGFTVGQQYTIQWPAFNGSRSGCSPSNPDRCFVSDPCSGESLASKAAATEFWGSSTNGYWGDNASSVINEMIQDAIQIAPVSIGSPMNMTSGNKATTARALDARVNQDINRLDNNVDSYRRSPHNNRRFIGVPVVDPRADGTFVLTYASFLLIGNGSPSDYYQRNIGNEPFCAIYAGGYTQGGGGGGANGYYVVRLVE